MEVEGILVFFSQLFCDLKKKVTSQICFGKGKAEGSWLAPWALSTAGCFVCWAEVVEAEQGQLPGSLRERLAFSAWLLRARQRTGLVRNADFRPP